jgi:hypothetical protein
VTVPRHFLRRIPNGFQALSLCAACILTLLIGGLSSTSFARDPLIAYSQNSASEDEKIYYSQYQSGNWTTGTYAVTNPESTAYDQGWKVARTHPDGTKQAVVWKNGQEYANARFYASIWDGTNWDDGTGSPYGDVWWYNLGIGTELYRTHDAAFEQSSGELLVVTRTQNAGALRYWVWNGTSWTSGSGSTYNFGTGSLGRWVKMAAKPGSNQIALISSWENGYVEFAIWDGDSNSWGNTGAGTTSAGNTTTDAIDIQYVQSGTYAGDIVAVWGEGQYVKRRIWTGSSWNSTATVADLGSGKRAYWLKLKPNPGGDGLILAIGGTYTRTPDTGLITINVNAAARTFTRSSGSFLTDGFAVGDSITTSGFTNAGNNTSKAIESLTPTVITVSDGTGLVNETGNGNERVVTGTRTLDSGSNTITVSAAAKTFTRSSGSYLSDGFMAGDQIITSGFTNAGNNTVKTIQTVTDLVITVTDNTGLVNETGNGNERIWRTYSLFTVPYDGDTRTFGSLSSAHTSALYASPDYNRPFDVMWDTASGSNNAVLVYADQTGLRYKTSSDGGSSWNSQQDVSTSYQAYWVQLERVLNTIYLAIHDNADDLRTWTWASSSWTAKNTITTDLETGFDTTANRHYESFAIAGNTSSTYKLEKHIAPLQGSFDVSTTGTSYADLGTTSTGNAVIISWDATKYTGATVYFEAVLKSDNASGIAYAKLYDVTATAEVANSEVSVTGTTYTRVRSSPITLTSGNQYKVIIKTNNASYTASLRASRLIVIQEASSITATETYILLHGKISRGIAYGNSPYTQSFYYDSSRFDGTVNIYFEVTMMTSAGTGYARLYNNTDGAAVANSEITTTSTSMVRVRSSALTLTSGKEYTMQLKGETGTTYITSAVLIIQQSGTITTTETHFPVITSYQNAVSTFYDDSYFPLYYDPGNWSRVSNTFFHQVYALSQDLQSVNYTELYNSTGTSSLDQRLISQATWAKLGPSSPLGMPSSASTLTGRQKYAGSGGTNYAASRLIVQSRTGARTKIEKQVHLQSYENMGSTGSSWSHIDDGMYAISGIPFYWDSTKYTSPYVYFEAVLKTGNASYFATAALFKKGADRASDVLVAESQVYTFSTSMERVRSGRVLLTNGEQYIVKIKNSGAITSNINTCRLIIFQEASSLDKTESTFLLSGYGYKLGGGYPGGYSEATDAVRFYYDSSQFDGTITVYFEAGLYASGGTGYARLYNLTDSTAVSGSEVSSTNTYYEVYDWKRSGAITLTTGKEYTVQTTNSTASSDSTEMGLAHIIIQQSGTGLTKTESHYQLGFQGITETLSSYNDWKYYNLYEPGNWSFPNLTGYHEATFKMSATNTGYVQLWNNTNGSSLDIRSSSSTTLTRWRSTSFTMPDSNKELTMRAMRDTSGTLTINGNRLIVQTSGSPTVVFLASFTAKGSGKHVKVDWQTASEINNLGFNLYRSTKKGGRYTKLNKSLIPGLFSSPTGKSYTYLDKNVRKGKLYYYKLEDIDLSGKRTMHGPICVDWNGDGIPDDEQLKTNPGLNEGGSGRRPVMMNSKFKSPYDKGSRVIAAEKNSFTARQKQDRVLLEWRSAYEVNVLGYHVYREENGEFIRLTPELVAGSALFAGNALMAGNAYSWWDTLATESRESSVVSGQSSVVKYKPDGAASGSPPPIPSPLEGEGRGEGAFTSPNAERRTPNDLLSTPSLTLPPRGGGPGWGGLSTQSPGIRGKTDALASSPEGTLLEQSDPQVTPEVERSSNRGVTYWLEEVQLDGTQTWCGPVAPVLDETLELRDRVASSYSPLLSKLAEEDAATQTLFPSGVKSTLQPKNALGSISAWDLAGIPAIKLSVNERGWYRVTQAQLLAAGLDPGVNPRFLQLFVDGNEQPILVRGQKDGVLDPEDTIEFYAEGLDTLFTDTRLYWLVPGAVPGRRITTIVNRPGPASSESSFSSTLEFKERSMYFSALKNGEQNNFFGPVIGAQPLERTLEIQNLASYRGKTTLSVSVQGVTVKPHRVRVLLNGVSLGTISFEGQSHKQAEFVLSHSRLRNGENTLRLLAEGDELDVSLLDTVQLTYRHTYAADEDSLLCRVSQAGMVTINGFSSPNVRVVDITDPADVKMVGTTAVQQGPSTYSARVYHNARGGNRTWYAFSEETIKTPVEIKANQVSTWHQEDKAADLVIISHGDFKDSLQPLKTHRESQGFSVALIDVEDIYDEFSYGTKTPQAIKDFLTRANTSWQTPPRFVLLVGDASFDPRNYLGLGNQDFLPTKILDTAYMETASDDWFVDFNGDGLPEMAVGRLPVQTPEEATQVVTKIIAYDQAEAGDWATEALMVADQNSSFDFEGGSQEVSDLLPEWMTVWSVYRGQVGDAAARTAILGSINEGKLMVNYIGHGAVDLWQGSVLTVSDADSLTNGSALPLVVGMTCLNGFFQTPYVESLAEALLKAENGGAVAVWTSSSLTDPAGQLQMNKGLMRLLFNGEGLTLGETTAGAKASTDDMDVRRSWILFGDPSTRLK